MYATSTFHKGELKSDIAPSRFAPGCLNLSPVFPYKDQSGFTVNAAQAPGTAEPHAAPTLASGGLAVGPANFKHPWLTFALLAILIEVFALENLFAVTPSVRLTLSGPTLIALGGLTREAVFAGREWFRLFTAPLLHVSLAHVMGNGVALLVGGWLLERLIGRLWFLALFCITALSGSLMSLAIAPPNTISVGVSGALMGMFAALFVISFHMPTGTAARIRLQISSLGVLIPSLVPLFSVSADQMDYGAHLGGALGGTVVAVLLLKFWPQTDRFPQLRKTAAAVSIIGAILFGMSAAIVVTRYPKYLVRLDLNGSSDHGPGRVACDGQWSDLLQNGSEKPAISYPDFIQNCMNKNIQ
jgi:membrane associated rhomboid family serine protease